MGLLEKCQQILNENLPPAPVVQDIEDTQDIQTGESYTFGDLCAKYKFLQAAFLKIETDVYVVQNSTGLCAKTIYQCISTKTFWQGTLAKPNTWYIFCADTMGDFFQLFDKNEIPKIKSLALIRLSNVLQEGIFFAYTTEDKGLDLPQDIAVFCKELYNLKYQEPLDFEKVKQSTQNKNYRLGVISCQNAIENSIEEFEMLQPEIKQRLKNVIFEEIYNLIQRGLGGNNIATFDAQKEIKVAFTSPPELNEKLFLMHLQNSLQKVIGKFAVQFVSYLDAGFCKNAKGLDSFLL